MPLRSHRTTSLTSLAVLSTAVLGCAASGGDVAPQAPSAPAPASVPAPASAPSLADGAYTAEQAERGAELFGQVCGECHATREFRGSDFFFNWEGSSVGRFFDLVVETMPEDDPGGLPTEQYLAVAAYVLQLNGYPAGATPLSADAERLGALTFERPGAASTPVGSRER